MLLLTTAAELLLLQERVSEVPETPPPKEQPMDLAEITPSQQVHCEECTCLELQGVVEQMLSEAHQLASKLSHAAVVEQQLESKLASCEQDLLQSQQQSTEAEAAWEDKYLELAQKEAAWEAKYVELEMRLNVLDSSLVDSKATASTEVMQLRRELGSCQTALETAREQHLEAAGDVQSMRKVMEKEVTILLELVCQSFDQLNRHLELCCFDVVVW